MGTTGNPSRFLDAMLVRPYGRHMSPLKTLGLLVCIMGCCSTLHAEEKQKEEMPDGWRGTHNVGVTLATGNSESLHATVGLGLTRRFGSWESRANLAAVFGMDDSVRSQERYEGSLQINRDLNSGRYYAGLTTDFIYDPIAGVKYRGGVTPLLGFRVSDTERFKFRLEAGPGYIWEKRDDVERNYSSLRFHEEMSYQLLESTRVFQSLTAVIEAEDLGNFVLTADAGIETKIIGHWSLRLAAQAIHYGETLGKDHDDLLITAGLGYHYLPQDVEAGSLGAAHKNRNGDQNDWVVTALLGGNYASGNSEARAINTGLEVKRTGGRSELAGSLFGTYGETTGRASAQALTADAHYQRLIAIGFFGGVRADFDHDELADLDWRLALTPYIGWELWERKRTKLTFELGPSFVREDQGGVESDYLGSYAALKAEQTIGSGTRLFADVSWLSESDDWASYILTSEFGVDQKISSKVSLKFLARSVYDSMPAAGRQEHDLQLVSALAVTF